MFGGMKYRITKKKRQQKTILNGQTETSDILKWKNSVVKKEQSQSSQITRKACVRQANGSLRVLPGKAQITKNRVITS